ncbi:hypothetical protein FRC03_001500 [Tulasnella sp. 419]|nr:hypothetical protein FRC03_001500 [Tulasnella sp. 419]
MFGLFRRKRWAHRGDTSVAPDEKGKRDWQDYFNDDKSPTWTHHFGEPVGKNHPIWKTYVRVALAHDHEYVEAMARDMENLLVFSTLFSAVVTTCLLQFEQQLQTLSSEDDPAIYTAYAVRYLINNQINLFLQSLGIKTSSFPTLEETSPDPYFPTIAISLWYFSLDCALLVAGGAVCVKQWLLQYEKANKLHHSAYERAIHHQQRSRNMQKWHVQEFGDFLGSLMLLDLIPFFAGSLYHYDVSNTGAAAFNGIASGFLCVYTAFIAFTIIVGVLMPTSPFRTPISNLIESIPRNLADDFRNGTVTKAILALPFVISIAIISFLWTKTSVYIFWTILLCLAPMILCIFLGLRNGLKMGRVSHFVPIMSIGITILATLSLGFVDLHPYVFGDVLRVGFPFIYTAISFLVISGLSQRFSNPGSERRLPVNAVLLGSAGLVAGLYIAWLYTFVAFEFTDPVSDQVFITYWATPVASSIVLASTAILCVAFLVPEDEVEEDIREAEALGWLMNQTSDSQILHDALLCLLGLASTPLRRRELLDKTRSILASLINSMIDPPEQLCLLADGREDMVGSGRAYEAGHDSRLTFYVACLAELSQAVIQTRRHDHRREMRWNRWVTRLRGSWIPINWYRILTFVPHHTLEREHRFPRSWYSWFHSKKPETLLSDLRVLTSRQDRYLSAMARAALSQLYPSYSPLHDRRLWPVRYSDQSEDNSFFTLHRVLIEFRMVTIWAIGECCWKKSLGISLRRYLYRYCDDMMKFWMERVAWLEAPRKPSGGDNENVDEEVEEAVEQVPEDRARLIRQYGTAFRAVTELGYVIIENHHDLLRTTQSGESTPMKAARCLMALSRWFDGLQPDLDLELDLELDLDGEVYRSFAHSMISATRTYLLLAVKHYKPSRQHHSKEQIMEHDENTIFVGMKHLETPLIHLACRSWNDDRLAKLAISTLEDFYISPYSFRYYACRTSLSNPCLREDSQPGLTAGERSINTPQLEISS